MLRTPTAVLLLAALLLPYAAAAQSVVQPGEIRVYPGDVVRVQVWQEPDLSGEFPVDENGVLTLPLLGQQQVTGVTVAELRDRLLGLYAEQLRNPAVTITPLRRISVLGEVRSPGLLPIDPTVSLSGAVALAGGSTTTGDLGRIRIVRDGRTVRERVDVTETVAAADIRSGDQIIVGRRSWLDRNSTAVVSAILSATGILVSIIISSRRSSSTEGS